jgi:hypothetical protein
MWSREREPGHGQPLWGHKGKKESTCAGALGLGSVARLWAAHEEAVDALPAEQVAARGDRRLRDGVSQAYRAPELCLTLPSRDTRHTRHKLRW